MYDGAFGSVRAASREAITRLMELAQESYIPLSSPPSPNPVCISPYPATIVRSLPLISVQGTALAWKSELLAAISVQYAIARRADLSHRAIAQLQSLSSNSSEKPFSYYWGALAGQIALAGQYEQAIRTLDDAEYNSETNRAVLSIILKQISSGSGISRSRQRSLLNQLQTAASSKLTGVDAYDFLLALFTQYHQWGFKPESNIVLIRASHIAQDLFQDNWQRSLRSVEQVQPGTPLTVRKPGELSPEAQFQQAPERLIQVAEAYRQIEEATQAQQFVESLRLRQKTTTHLSLLSVKSLTQLAHLFYTVGDVGQANHLLRNALQRTQSQLFAAKQSDDIHDASRQLGEIAATYALLKQHGGVQKILQLLNQLPQRINDPSVSPVEFLYPLKEQIAKQYVLSSQDDRAFRIAATSGDRELQIVGSLLDIYIQQERFEAFAQRAVQLPSHHYLDKLLGRAAVQAAAVGQTEVASKIITHLLQSNRFQPAPLRTHPFEFRMSLAKYLTNTQQPQLAMPFLDQALAALQQFTTQFDRRNQGRLVAIADLYAATGHYNRAISILNQVLELVQASDSPIFVTAYFSGDSWERTTLPDLVKPLFEKDSSFSVSELYYQPTAESDYEIIREPDYRAIAFAELARHYAIAQDFAKAQELMEEVSVEYCQLRTSTFRALTQIALKNQQPELALKFFTTARLATPTAISPDHPTLGTIQTLIEVAKQLNQQGQRDQAVQVLDQAMQQFPP